MAKRKTKDPKVGTGKKPKKASIAKKGKTVLKKQKEKKVKK